MKAVATRILVGSRVSYKSLASDKVYYGTLTSYINDDWAAIDSGDPKPRPIRVSRLKFIPNVFAGACK